MARMRHPKTGEWVRTEEVCHHYDWRTGEMTYYNPPEFEHDFERTKSTWAEIEDTCKLCGYSIYASI